VRVLGDLPFMISGDSPDVWARREQFMLDATVGVPPDAFSETGQDWGLPPWRWDVMQSTGFQWMRARARRTAALFDGVRIDHLVGLYRIYVRPTDTTRDKVFSPPDEPAQSLLGAKILSLYLQSGIEVVAEDLGTVPPFVRHSMARLGVPGFKVMRWERAWDADGKPFVDPAEYPDVSVGLSGTHDTEPLAQWWRELADDDRAAFLALPSLAASGVTAASPFVPDVRDAVVGALIAGAARTVMLPLQDVFGWDARINTPATVNDQNWTWRVAQPVDGWRDAPEWVACAERLRAWCLAARRYPAHL
jgi:4-alpha-glucanotransferase